MTLSSACIELFIRGKSPGEMSGGKCPDTVMKHQGLCPRLINKNILLGWWKPQCSGTPCTCLNLALGLLLRIFLYG